MGQSSSIYTTYKNESSDSQRPELTNSPHDKDLEAQEIEEVEKQDSHRVERSELVDGDHIYYWSSFRYSHHGIYIGNNLVIHFVNQTGGNSSGSGSGSFSVPGAPDVYKRISKFASSCPSDAISCSSVLKGHYLKNNGGSSHGKDPLNCLNTEECGYRRPGTGVYLNCLNCFLVKKRSLFRYEYGVSRSNFEKEIRGGTCTTAESGSPKQVYDRAIYLLEEGFGKYDLEKLNCEDFSLYCKTGLLAPNKNSQPTSGQINFVLNLASSRRQGKTTEYGSKMYFRDIRTDVRPVAPKDVAAFLHRRDRQQKAPAA